MKKDAYYFSHDSNAKDDPKCALLFESIGPEGYGIYWVLIEILREQPNYEYPLALLGSVARKYNTDKDIVLNVIRAFDLFKYDDEVFYSESLKARMEIVNQKRGKFSESGKYGNIVRWKKNYSSSKNEDIDDTQTHPNLNPIATQSQPDRNPIATQSPPDRDLIATQSQLKERKEKDSKEKEIRENIFIKPTLSQIEEYCRHRSNKIDPEKFFNHYESRGWCMGKNKTPMSDWKAAIHNWERNDRNETNACLGVDERINEFGNRTYGKSGIIVPAEAPPRPTKNHLWSIHDKAWRINL